MHAVFIEEASAAFSESGSVRERGFAMALGMLYYPRFRALVKLAKWQLPEVIDHVFAPESRLSTDAFVCELESAWVRQRGVEPLT